MLHTKRERPRGPRAGTQPLLEPERDVGLRVDEGALPLVAAISSSYRDSSYKRGFGKWNDGRPSSKPAASQAMCDPSVFMCTYRGGAFGGQGSLSSDSTDVNMCADARHAHQMVHTWNLSTHVWCIRQFWCEPKAENKRDCMPVPGR